MSLRKIFTNKKFMHIWIGSISLHVNTKGVAIAQEGNSHVWMGILVPVDIIH